jgi:hypothetical protein
MFMFTMLDGRYSRGLLQPLRDIKEFYGILKRVPICTRLGSRGLLVHPNVCKDCMGAGFPASGTVSQVSSAKPATLGRLLALSNVCLVNEVAE